MLLFAAALLLLGDTFRLYLKDGDYHIVREYQVQGDRVRYYSTERGDWEEIPTELVDLEKTEQQRKAKDDEVTKESQEENEERQAQREQVREIKSIPANVGAYYKVGDQVRPLKMADYDVITSKKRKTLQVLSPIPLVPGKASVVIKGEHSAFTIAEDRPSFFMRLAKEERFGIIRLEPKKNVRVVEDISIAPVAKVAMENRKQMETFQQELESGLYRVWPEKPLTPGEYAVVEFADNEDKDDIELMIWDFAVEGAK